MRKLFSTRVKVILVLAILLTAGLAVLSSVTGQPHTQQAQQIKKILNDPEAAKKILSSPAAKKLLDSLNSKK